MFVELSQKEKFVAHLDRNEIAHSCHYPMALHRQPVMKTVAFKVAGELKMAELLVQQEVSIPINPYLNDEEVRVICKALESF